MNYVIIGATSAIAKATARLWAKPDACFYLVARDEDALQRNRDDLLARGAAAVEICTADLLDLDAHEALDATISENVGSIDVV